MYIKNERGSGPVFEVILAALVLSLIGLAIYTYTNHLAKQTPKSAASIDPTANWLTYSSTSGEFSLKYSPNWRLYAYAGYAAAACHKDAPDSSIDFNTQKADDTLITVCGGENPGQVHVSSSAGAKNIKPSFGGSTDGLYTDITKENVTVDGVEGVRYSAVASRQLLGIDKGGKDIEYSFYHNGRNYGFVLMQNPGQNAELDFDLMVKNTVRFNLASKATPKSTFSQGTTRVKDFFDKYAQVSRDIQTPSSPGNAIPDYLASDLAKDLEHSDSQKAKVDIQCGVSGATPTKYTYSLVEVLPESALVDATGMYSNGKKAITRAEINLNSLLITAITCPN